MMEPQGLEPNHKIRGSDCIRQGTGTKDRTDTIQFSLRTEHAECSLEGREWYCVRKDSSLGSVESRLLGVLAANLSFRSHCPQVVLRWCPWVTKER